MPVMLKGVETTTNIEQETKVRFVDPGYILKEARISPIFAITQAIPDSKMVDQDEFEWFVKELSPWVDEVDTGGALSTDKVIPVKNPEYWNLDDFFVDADSGEMAGPIIEITATTIEVYERGVTGTPAALLQDSNLIIIRGNVQEAGTAAEAITTKPQKITNYIESVSQSIKVSRRLDNDRLYTGSERVNERRQKYIEHREVIELILIYGDKAFQSNPTTGNRWLSKGFKQGITTLVKSIDVGSGTKTFDEDDWNSYLALASTYGDNERTFFSSAEVLQRVNKFGLDGMRTRPADAKLGVAVTSYTSPFIDVNLIRHRFFSAKYGTDWTGMAVDFMDVSLRFKLRTRLNVAIQAKADKFIWDEIETEMGLKIGNEALSSRFEVVNS